MARCLVVLTVAALAACQDAVGPHVGPVRLEAMIGRSTIAVGDTTSVVFRLRNASTMPVTLTFSDGCPVLLPYVTDRASNQLVYSPGGGCLTVITEITLPPQDARVYTVVVRGWAPGDPVFPPEVPLAPGRYLISARLGHPFETQWEPVALTVQ